MQKDREELAVGVLDIYGFEIFMVQTKHFDMCTFSINVTS